GFVEQSVQSAYYEPATPFFHGGFAHVTFFGSLRYSFFLSHTPARAASASTRPAPRAGGVAPVLQVSRSSPLNQLRNRSSHSASLLVLAPSSSQYFHNIFVGETCEGHRQIILKPFIFQRNYWFCWFGFAADRGPKHSVRYPKFRIAANTRSCNFVCTTDVLLMMWEKAPMEIRPLGNVPHCHRRSCDSANQKASASVGLCCCHVALIIANLLSNGI